LSRDKLPTAKVLIVDHHARNARDLNQLLTNCGYDSRIVNSANAALVESKAFAPDFVLLDLGLPHGDCGQLAAALKAITPCTVIGIGGKPGAVIAKSIDFSLKKPFSFEALQNLLKQARSTKKPSDKDAASQQLVDNALDVLRKTLKPNSSEFTQQESHLLTELAKLPDARLSSLLKLAEGGN